MVLRRGYCLEITLFHRRLGCNKATRWALMFSLAAHPLVLKLARLGRNGNPGKQLDAIMFYSDDGMLCGSAQAVAEALALLSSQCVDIGLDLNLGKCELVTMSPLEPDLENMFPAQLLNDHRTRRS